MCRTVRKPQMLGLAATMLAAVACGGDSRACDWPVPSESGRCPTDTVALGNECVCNADLVFALSVAVRDAQTGAALCDATVVASNGESTESLRSYSTQPPCWITGFAETPGTFTVASSRDGYDSALVPSVSVSAGLCHVHTVSLEILLNPS
jgi:hypothetical protein